MLDLPALFLEIGDVVNHLHSISQMASLESPFQSLPLHTDNYVGSDGAGHVVAISDNIVVKYSLLYDNPDPSEIEDMEGAIPKIEREKLFYQALTHHRHPNITYCILCVPEGLFMQRQQTDLSDRLQSGPVPYDVQERWIRQLVSAVAWLESLGYVHGDLRPDNVLLDRHENIKLADFDAAVKYGEELLVPPFCSTDEDFEFPLAGALSEQYSLASCMYSIRFGHEPYHDLDESLADEKMSRRESPSTAEDVLFGQIMQACWRDDYATIGDVERDVLAQLSKHERTEVETKGPFTMGVLESCLLLAECKLFLANESLVVKNSGYYGRERLDYWSHWVWHGFLGALVTVRDSWRRLVTSS